MTPPLLIENCAIATMDGRRHDESGTEYASGYVVVAGGRITAVGEGQAPHAAADGARRVDGTGCLATPGLINAHHHLYQWLTQGQAQQSILFDWLTELYPVWARIDPEQVHAAATAGLAWLALSGCSTSTDHHYIFPPRGGAGPGVPAAGPRDALEAEIAAAASVGLRFHPCRGSMDLGRSAGGLPPDEIVEDPDTALAATEEAIRRFHDPGPGRHGAGRGGPVLPVLGQPQAHAGDGGAGPRARRQDAHPPGRDPRGRRVLPADARPHARRVRRRTRLARRGRVAGALRAPRRACGEAVRRDRHLGGPLPELERAARRGHRPGTPAAAGRRSGRPRGGRPGLQRGHLPGRGAAPGAARRPGQGLRRRRRADRPAGAVARDPRRRPLPGPGRTRSARCGRACSPTSRCGGSTRSRTTPSRTGPTGRGAAIRSPRSCSGRPRRSSCSWSAARPWSSTASCAPPT